MAYYIQSSYNTASTADDFIYYHFITLLIRRGYSKQCSGSREEGHSINTQSTGPDPGDSGGVERRQGSNLGP